MVNFRFAALAQWSRSCAFDQPRNPGSLPTPGAATKTLVQAGHVTLSKIFCLVWWGKYKITCFHIKVIHFKCNERDVMVAKNNMNFF